MVSLWSIYVSPIQFCFLVGLKLRYQSLIDQLILSGIDSEVVSHDQYNEVVNSVRTLVKPRIDYRSIVSCHEQYYKDLAAYVNVTSSKLSQIFRQRSSSYTAINEIWMMNYLEFLALQCVRLEDVSLMIEIMISTINLNMNEY